MSSFPDSDIFAAAQMHMAYGNPRPQTPDQWKQYRQPLDPASLPSSPLSPAFSPASSPRTPRGSPTVTKQLNKFADLSLNNGQPISSGISTGSPLLHRSLFNENNDTSRVENLPPLGPSLTRRTQALSTDNSHGASRHPPDVGPTAPHHTSTVRPDKHSLEYRGVPVGTRGRGGERSRHSRLPIPLMQMPPPIDFLGDAGVPPCSDAELNDWLNAFESTAADIAIFTDGPTTSVGLPIRNADPFVFPPADLPSHSHAVSQFDAPHPLTGPHEVQEDYCSHKAPSDPAASMEGGSDSKQSHSKVHMLKSFYLDNFKRSQLFQACELRLKEKVGSIKTGQASLKKRKDGARWVCPFDGTTFTRKQNLKLHIQSHLGIKDHKCICGAPFNALSGLKRHQSKCRHFLLATT